MRKMLNSVVAVLWCLTLILGITIIPDSATAGNKNLLETIKDSGEVHMGFREGSVPFGFMDKGGAWVGFGLDMGAEVVRELEKKFNKPIKLVKHPMNPKTRITMVANGMVAMGIGSTTITLAREDVVDFSLPYFLTGTRLLVPRDSPVSSFADIGGKRVGMGSGSTANIKGMDRAIAQGQIKPACQKILFEEHNKGFLALQQGKIDAYFTDASQLAGMRAKAKKPEDWKIVGKYLTYEPYGIILPENQGEWRDFVNKAFIHMLKDGRFEALYTKWFGPDGVVPLPMTDEYKVLLKSLSYPE
ncbi:transporter substrate-binding domain-containing protein [Desulfobacula phenolica]|nr:transporter substrate-binding domain-containing protein [Desulfobacula phenolica]SDU04703.1 amino acid ABC transporter substrate-binding protein, PAAT family [Desulfobacula phenolica]